MKTSFALEVMCVGMGWTCCVCLQEVERERARETRSLEHASLAAGPVEW